MSTDQEQATPLRTIPKWLMWAVSKDNNYQPTLLGHVALSGALISIKDNLEASQKIYVNYLGLRNEVLSYLATGETISNESLAPAKFIHYVDREFNFLDLRSH